MGLILCCAILLGFSKIVIVEAISNGEEPKISVWVPVILGLCVPVTFAIDSNYSKFLITSKGVPTNDFTFTSNLIGATFQCIGGIFYFALVDFNWPIFVIGFFGCLIITAADFFNRRALTAGPMGPAFAIMNGAVVLVTIIQSFRYWKLPSLLEFIGLVIGVSGMLVLTL